MSETTAKLRFELTEFVAINAVDCYYDMGCKL